MPNFVLGIWNFLLVAMTYHDNQCATLVRLRSNTTLHKANMPSQYMNEPTNMTCPLNCEVQTPQDTQRHIFQCKCRWEGIGRTHANKVWAHHTWDSYPAEEDHHEIYATMGEERGDPGETHEKKT